MNIRLDEFGITAEVDYVQSVRFNGKNIIDDADEFYIESITFDDGNDASSLLDDDNWKDRLNTAAFEQLIQEEEDNELFSQIALVERYEYEEHRPW